MVTFTATLGGVSGSLVTSVASSPFRLSFDLWTLPPLVTVGVPGLVLGSGDGSVWWPAASSAVPITPAHVTEVGLGAYELFATPTEAATTGVGYAHFTPSGTLPRDVFEFFTNPADPILYEVPFVVTSLADRLDGDDSAHTFALGDVKLQFSGGAAVSQPTSQIQHRVGNLFCVVLTPAQRLNTARVKVSYAPTSSTIQYTAEYTMVGGSIVATTYPMTLPMHLASPADPLVPVTGYSPAPGELQALYPAVGAFADVASGQLVSIGDGDYDIIADTTANGTAYACATPDASQPWRGAYFIATADDPIIYEVPFELASALGDLRADLTGRTPSAWLRFDDGLGFVDCSSAVSERGLNMYAIVLTDAQQAIGGRVYYRVPGTSDTAELVGFYDLAQPVLVGARGPAVGAAVFVVSLESGATVTYEWATDIMPSISGLETRVATLPDPRQTYKVSALLVDGAARDVRSQLVHGAATGQAFQLGLAYEEALTTGAGGLTATLPVGSTAPLDWAGSGQQVLVVTPDGTATEATIVGVSPTTITLDRAVNDALMSRVMPLVAIFLDPKQTFARYPVNLEEWQIAARAADYPTFSGAGATVTTFAGTPVWDRGVDVDGTAEDSTLAHTEVVDFGGIPANFGDAQIVDGGRALRYESTSIADWQWLKLFLATARGCQRRFYVPSGRADLVLAAQLSPTSITVRIGASYGDYSQLWSNSQSHALAVYTTDGAVAYLSAIALVNNGDGTLTLTLLTAVSGTIDQISLLDSCRFESDSMPVQWDGGMFTFAAVAHVVQQ